MNSMSRFKKEHVVVFIPTFFVLNVLAGLNILIRMNFSLSNDYEAFSFIGGKPSEIKMLLMGFRNLQDIFYFICLTLVFTMISVSFIRSQIIKNGGRSGTILNSVILTFLLASLYIMYKLLYAFKFNKEYFNVYWSDIKRETLILFIIYLFISIPITFLSSKQIAKSIKL